jgi:hypothetical protein
MPSNSIKKSNQKSKVSSSKKSDNNKDKSGGCSSVTKSKLIEFLLFNS